MTPADGAAHARNTLFASVAVALCMAVSMPGAVAGEDAEIWQSVRSDVFGDERKIADGSGKLKLEAPYRAEDAAIVPITVTIPASIAPKVRKLTLLVEKNPAPVVAAFKFGEAAGLGERRISTRVRVDMYSNVRAVIEMADGSLHMQTKFVKAAGGCSAPALKDMDAALASIGKMKLRALQPKTQQSSRPISEAQVMVKHPNYSGMQMNQLTGLYIPAKFVEHMEVRKGDAVVFEMEGGISLSTDPNIRFTYSSKIEGPLSVSVRDTDKRAFKAVAVAKGS
ncbi:MAG: quinoprotein dehydrogenase-associated SoxYZ-like carrier [Alphaproteobacteria bacterium]|nr:quinoprotein dehydrogenase-associated SoxYZ-like carrier [Alphaproteobacteria bacterium]